ncbi:hypothetical protein [Pacificibacter maritimus]|nr:hypothetical protein [Pacificibacter maritimus]
MRAKRRRMRATSPRPAADTFATGRLDLVFLRVGRLCDLEVVAFLAMAQ